MVPMGIEDAKYVMHFIEIWNDVSGNLNKGNYRYRITRKLSRNAVFNPAYVHSYPTWKTGAIADFPRAQKNSLWLLREVLNNACRERV